MMTRRTTAAIVLAVAMMAPACGDIPLGVGSPPRLRHQHRILCGGACPLPRPVMPGPG